MNIKEEAQISKNFFRVKCGNLFFLLFKFLTIILQMYNQLWGYSPYYPYFPYTSSHIYLPQVLNSPRFHQTEGHQEENDFQKFLLNRTRHDVQQINHSIAKKPWKKEEDEKLIYLVEVKGCSWNEISHEMGNRNYKMCYSRYKRLKSLNENQWSDSQDKRLQQLVQKKGLKWKKIVQYFPGKNSKEIRQRYVNILKPSISGKIWSIEEDEHLLKLINQHGKKWKMIEKQIPNRDQSQLRSRYQKKNLKICKKRNS